MRDFITKYEVWVFLALAPLLNTVITYANSKGIISDSVYGHGRFYALLLSLVCLITFTRGVRGVKDLFRPMLVWKINPKWYLFSLLFALTICALTLLLKSLYYGIDYSSLMKFNFPSIRYAFVLLTWAFMGEVVWVSYAIRELSKTLNSFYASQIIGFFWTCWWLPSVLINAGVIPDLPLWPLLLNMLGVAGMCAVVYGKTKSGLCVWLLQFMLNMSMLALPVSPTTGGIPTYKAFAVLYFVTMLCFMYVINPAKKLKAQVTFDEP
ncbi:hypothetical protein [Parapedobacter tibetensis]|uniref:hypothetical protein n=1 Tax=Parapedobacter tibetensis TaxID=2972951 RepID=UPI00214D4B8D|nr:hypothetical protein [Parapedobacter tibetensis]